VPPPLKCALIHTSQSPAVSEIEVTFAAAPVVRGTAEPLAIDETTYSPTPPASALSLVAVPRVAQLRCPPRPRTPVGPIDQEDIADSHDGYGRFGIWANSGI